MGEKSVGQILAGFVMGAVSSATGATQGEEIQTYVDSQRASSSSRSEEISRSIDVESRVSSDQSGQGK